MKMVTSIVFEIKMPDEEIEAYKALSENEREIRTETMKSELSEIIASECTGEINFTKFTIKFQEGE